MRLTGGERGIRTLEAFRLTHFPGVLFQPLRHLSRHIIENDQNKRQLFIALALIPKVS